MSGTRRRIAVIGAAIGACAAAAIVVLILVHGGAGHATGQLAGATPPTPSPSAIASATAQAAGARAPTPGAVASATAQAAGARAPTPGAVASATAHGCTQPSAPPLPADATAVSTATGDFDGDGAADELMMYRVPSSRDDWHVRVVLADGYALDQQVAIGGPITIPSAAIGGADVDGDGADEAFVVVGSGAYTFWVGLYHFDKTACSLDRVLAPGGGAYFAPVGASVRNLAGLQCVTTGPTGVPALAQLSGGSDDGRSYRGTRQFFTLSGHQLTSAGTESAVFMGDDATLKCGGLALH